jgi:hypothetical protein
MKYLQLFRTVVIKLLLCSAPYQENNWRSIKDLRFLNDGLGDAETSLARTDRLSPEKDFTTQNVTTDTLRTAWKEIYVQLLLYFRLYYAF